jgi:hypothetical protein
MSASKVSSDQQHQVTDFYPGTVVKEPRSYPRTMRPKNSGQGKLPTPNSDSPFYMPPPSSKALRWSIVLCLIGPFLFACAAFESARAHDWTVLGGGCRTYGLRKRMGHREVAPRDTRG